MVLFCFSCSKKAHIFEKDIYNSEQKQLVTNWGQTVNGRWIPYLLKKAKKESKNSDTQKSIELFAHYMQTLNHVKEEMKMKVVNGLGIDLESDPNILDQIYRENYNVINSNLKEEGVMDDLWLRYFNNNNYSNNNVGQPLRKLATTLPTVDVYGCDIKGIFDMFFVDVSLVPTTENTSLSELLYLTDESIHGCRTAKLAQIGLVIGSLPKAITPAECTLYGNQIYIYLQDYLNCPLDTDEDNEDPFPPTGGANNGGNQQSTAGDQAPLSYNWRNKLKTSDDFLQYLPKTEGLYKTNPDGSTMLDENLKGIPNLDAYNCHYYAFGANSDPDSYNMPFTKVLAYPDLSNFTELSPGSKIKVGDRILYIGWPDVNTKIITHSAIVTQVDPSGYAIEVSSKIGETYGIIKHHPRDIPEQ